MPLLLFLLFVGGYLYRMSKGEACSLLWGSAPWGGGGGGHSRRPLPLAPPLLGLGFRQPMLGSPIADHLSVPRGLSRSEESKCNRDSCVVKHYQFEQLGWHYGILVSKK